MDRNNTSIPHTACAVGASGHSLGRRSGHSLDPSLATLAHDVYDAGARELRDWYPVPADDLTMRGISPALLEADNTGFFARVYAHPEHGYVLTFRGTDDVADWISNLRQGVGLKESQYGHATKLATELQYVLGERLIGITGHSLGGGLAAVASLRTGVPAVTFNAAGVHDRTLDRLEITRDTRALAASTGHIRRYTVDNDILTELQEHVVPARLVLPDPIGHRISLSDPDPLSFIERQLSFKRIPHAFETHAMDSVTRALDAPLESTTRSQLASTLVLQSIRGIRALDGLQHFRGVPGTPAHGLLNAATFMAARARVGHDPHRPPVVQR